MTENNSVPEADGPNLAETKSRSPGDSRGGRPIRKRAYHRALKRGEPWAIVEQAHQRMMKLMAAQFYGNILDMMEPISLSRLSSIKVETNES